MWGLGVLTTCIVENSNITLQSALHTCSSTSKDSANLRWCSTMVCIYWKNPHMSGPAPFKPVLFKGQMYISSIISHTCVLDFLSFLDLWAYSFHQIWKIFWLLLFLIFLCFPYPCPLGTPIIHILCYLTLSYRTHWYPVEFFWTLFHFG